MGTYDISITDVYEEIVTQNETDINEKPSIETENTEENISSENIESIEETNKLHTKNLVVKGINFNEFSKIYINGKYTKTEFIDSNTLVVNDIILEPNSSIVVIQRTSGGGKLSSTNEFIYPCVIQE